MMSIDDSSRIGVPAIQPGSREAKMQNMVQNWLRRFHDVRGYEQCYESRPISEGVMSKAQKDANKIYHSLKQGRDGTRVLCIFCGVEFAILDSEVHHRDHVRIHNQLSNLEPACRTDNENEKAQWMSESRRRSDSGDGSVSNTKEREKDPYTDAEKLQQKLISEAPTTFQSSKSYKRQFFDYMFEYLGEAGRPYDLVVQEATAQIGCSKEWTEECIDVYAIASEDGSHFTPLLKEQAKKDPIYAEDGTVISSIPYIRLRPNPKFDIKLASPEYLAALKEHQKRKQESA